MLTALAGLLGLVVFAALLGVVSAAEQALLSLTETRMRRMIDGGNGRAERVQDLTRHPRRIVLTVTLAGSTFLGAGVFCLALAVGAWRPETPIAALFATMAGGLFLGIVGRVIPRSLSSARPEAAALGLARSFSAIQWAFRPATRVVDRIGGRLSADAAEELVEMEELKAVTEEQEDAAGLEEEKRELLHSVFEFGDTSAKEVMVPRIDMVMAEADTPRSELLELVSKHGHSRIPIFEESVDRIVGVVHVKQLICEESTGADPAARESMQPAIFVPESKRIDELLREFQERRAHLAIVVDEYGGTSGMVTMEDVLEEIVGEIQDEYDTEEELFEPLSDGSFRVAAKIDLDDLNEELNLRLPTENSDTLGGFLYELVGKVPSQGEVVDHDGLRFVIDRTHRQRIVRVRIERQDGARA
ncbi:MAG: hemolysin family protein [Gemmatimonadota bacterium]|jgi:CBS domain containing-hemolysin-like protein|nr:hemolysin family protein [Gemmatimonadota bacterium]MDP6529093.1 hemolysin family protein [Gemmatimonadota bacterium]MDP6801656.1 hemolysin family protein [Gemmatimonadota bacterium]MDP7030797.1 hemolysin family protein [Gemmatimonadota bacterium]